MRIRLIYEGGPTGLDMLINDIINRKNNNGPYLISVNDKGLTQHMLRGRFKNARVDAVNDALTSDNSKLADKIKQFQFRDTRF